MAAERGPGGQSAHKPTLHSTIEVTVEECEEVAKNAGREDLIRYMHDRGLSIMDSIKVVRWMYALSLGEAKRIVTAHPIWTNVVRNADTVHEQLIDALVHGSDSPSQD